MRTLANLTSTKIIAAYDVNMFDNTRLNLTRGAHTEPVVHTFGDEYDYIQI